MLDNFYSEYEMTLNERLDNVDALIKEVVDSVNANSEAIANTIMDAAKQAGYSLTDSMTTALVGDGSMITKYTQGLANELTTLNSAISEIAQNVANMAMVGDAAAAKTVSGMKVQGYSNGGYIAELQKIAMRNGDDMITVNTLKPGEAIMTPDQATQFSKLVNNLPVLHNLMTGSEHIPTVYSEATAGYGNVQYGDINVTFPIDHVQDYNELVSQIQKDAKFERFIEDITVGRMLGGGKLSKYNQKWK